MFKISKAWKWLKQYHTTILTFISILAMGAGIMPTINHGAAFLEALQFEKMAEASPVYAAVRDVESQTRFYVLSVEDIDSMAVLWVLPSSGSVIVDDKLDTELYVMFAALAKNYDAEIYLIIVAETVTIPAPTGFILAFSGVGYFTITADGAKMLGEAGIENANATLKMLYGNEFDAPSLEEQTFYMTNLLPRAPGHIAPWEEE